MNKSITLILGLVQISGFCSFTALAQTCPAGDLACLGDELAIHGIETSLSITSIYQANTKGGLSTNSRRGRWSGSYDFELSADMQKLLGLEDLSFYMLAEGGWPDEEGVDGASVGSFFGVNGDASGNRTLDITELWFEKALLDSSLFLRVGKIDLTGGFECKGCPVTFDGSAFANDETSQFLNNALVNNPTIPFPDNGLVIVAYYNPTDSWYIGVGVADAQADARETGFRTTFGDEDYFFYIAEAGITPQLDSENGPLQGAYRIGTWYDPQDKARLANSSSIKRDDVGFYLSCDQMLCRENKIDDQGLGIFARYGWTDSEVEPEVTNFISAGLQYTGIIEGRDEDVLGLGFAHGTFSNQNTSVFAGDFESAAELYYNAKICPSLNISPSIQYVTNPSSSANTSHADDAVVLAVRVQMAF